MYYIVFDIETTGLPSGKIRHKQDFKDHNKYDTCRMVQMAWIVLDEQKQVLKEQDYIIKRYMFDIPKNAVHDITNKISDTKGIELEDVLTEFEKDLKQYPNVLLVSHNIRFDYNVLLNHVYRCRDTSLLDTLLKVQTYCTMANSCALLKLPSKFYGSYKYPKLRELYAYYYPEKTFKEHDAMADTRVCVECFVQLNND